MKQKTIRKPITISGTGLHTGKKTKVTFKPAEVNFGYKFKRTDVDVDILIEADINLVVDTSRGTTLEKKGIRIYTVEHILASLFGLGVDNCLIEVNGEEIPILDGSAKLWVEAIEEAGVEEQESDINYFELKESIKFKDESKGIELIAIPCDEVKYTVLVDYNTKVLNKQYADLMELSDFKKEVSSCRTFVFLHELEYLISNNLVKGGDLNNAIVFVDRLTSADEQKRLSEFFGRPDVQVRSNGILNNIDLNFENEPARHKLLDLIGDLALIGRRIKAHFIAVKPGHTSNAKFGKEIKKYIENQEVLRGIPSYDPSVTPVYDINQIKNILPHRSPFLLVDKITSISENKVIGVKCITMDEPFFMGHFPDEPLFPGVLATEALAQTGGILVLHGVEDPEHYSTYFVKIEEVRFRNKIVPGDVMVMSMEFIQPVRRGMCYMKGEIYVGGKLCVEAKMMAQVIRNKA